MKKNLIYHIWPSKHASYQWKWNIDKLSEYIDVFDGKIIIAIAEENLKEFDDAWVVHQKRAEAGRVPEKLHEMVKLRHEIERERHQTSRAEEVKDYFSNKKISKNIEFITVKNQRHLHECSTFHKLLNKIEKKPLEENKDEITFYAHAKGQRRQRLLEAPQERLWVSFMYEQNLRNLDSIEEKLLDHPCLGVTMAFEPIDPVLAAHKGSWNKEKGWFYDGTFFWVNNYRLFSSPYCYNEELMTNWNGLEWYLCNLFKLEEAYDNTKKEYRPFFYRWLEDSLADNPNAGCGANYDMAHWYDFLEKYPESISWQNVEDWWDLDQKTMLHNIVPELKLPETTVDKV